MSCSLPSLPWGIRQTDRQLVMTWSRIWFSERNPPKLHLRERSRSAASGQQRSCLLLPAA